MRNFLTGVRPTKNKEKMTETTSVVWHAYPEEAPPFEYTEYLVTIKGRDGKSDGVKSRFWEIDNWSSYGEMIVAWAHFPDPYSSCSHVDDDTASTDYADIY